MDTFTSFPFATKQSNLNKRKPLIGKIKIKTKTSKRTLKITEQLGCERSDIQIVPVNKLVDSEPQVRMEGNIFVIPVCEDVIVKRVLIREEIRVTKQKTSSPYSDVVTLREEKARITREVKYLWRLKRLLRSIRYSR